MSLERNIYIIFDILMNILTIMLIVRVFLSLQAGHVRRSLSGFSLSYLGWLNMVMLLRIVDLSLQDAFIAAKIILSSVALMINFFIYFVFSLSDSQELKKKRNIIFPVNTVILILMSFMELVEVPVASEYGKYVADFKILFPYYSISLSLTAIYGVYRLYRNLKNITDEFTLFQFRYILAASIITTAGLTVTQVILPIVVGTNIISFYSNVIWPAIFIFFVLQLLTGGRVMFMKKIFLDFIKFPDFQLEKNMMNLRKLIYSLKRVFEGNHSYTQKTIVFDLKDDKKYSINIYGKNGSLHERWLISEPVNEISSINKISSLLDMVLHLENENKRLSKNIIKSKDYFSNNLLSQDMAQPDENILSVIGSLGIPENIKNNAFQREENYKLFGEYLIGQSIKFHEMLSRIRTVSESSQAVLFYGESGTGKALFAKALHRYRSGGEVLEFSCLGMDREEIKMKIRDFINLNDKKKPGIIVRHIDAVKPEDFGIFEPLLSDFGHKRFAYFTASNDIQLSLDAVKPVLKNRFNQIQIQTIPLREMKEDILLQSAWFLNSYTDNECGGYKFFDPKFVKSILNYDWPGNSMELRNTIQRAVLENAPPFFKNIQIGTEYGKFPEFKESGKLSPLEESEKIVISRYLKKNAYNKSKTKRELRITINTLNAKMKRYGIIPARTE